MNKSFPSSVLIMCIGNPSTTPRPRRIIELLMKNGCRLTAFSFPNKGDLKVNVKYPLEPPSFKIWNRIGRLVIRMIRSCLPVFNWQLKINAFVYGYTKFHSLDLSMYDLVVVEDIELLPLAVKRRSKSKILCDLREYYPLQFEDNVFFRFLESRFRQKICEEYLKQCDYLISVSPGLITMYEQNFGTKVFLIRSVPNYVDIKGSSPTGEIIQMVHHGNATRNRKLENMIEMFKYLDKRFRLDFYLKGNSDYLKYLKDMAKGYSSIRFLDPVEFKQIIKTITKYDIGLYLLEPTGFNTKHSLPNKFFEYIQARLMLAIGPSPDMASIVREYNCGVVSSDFTPQSLSRALNKLTVEDIVEAKMNANIAAEELCFENESRYFYEILNGNSTAASNND